LASAAPGENAATTQAANAADLICFVILNSLLQSTYGDNQTGPFENLHQFGENALVVLGAWFEVLLQYALRIVDRLKNQLLVGHLFLPIRSRRTDAKERSSLFLELSPQLLFREGTSGNGLACCSSFVLQFLTQKMSEIEPCATWSSCSEDSRSFNGRPPMWQTGHREFRA